MKNLLTACCIVLGVIFVYGFIFPARPDRVRIVAFEDKHTLNVTVTVFDVTPTDVWVSLHACTADRAESMQMYCNYFWETESTHPIRADQNQYPFLIRSVPGGLLKITAVVFDIDDKVLASAVIPYQKRY